MRSVFGCVRFGDLKFTRMALATLHIVATPCDREIILRTNTTLQPFGQGIEQPHHLDHVHERMEQLVCAQDQAVTSNPHHLRLLHASLRRRICEPVHDLGVAGEDQHLVGFGEVDE